MLADLFWVALFLVWMFSACKALKFIQFEVLRRNACDDFLIGGFGLQTGAFNPALDNGRMNALDARHSADTAR
jgi:hypothetical protein